MNFESYLDKSETLHALSEKLKSLIENRETSYFTLALSGGSTAKDMFEFWTRHYSQKILWRNVMFFWVDERCVGPHDDESNFKHANELFFKPLKISEDNIFRIRGEENPVAEAERYSKRSKEITLSDSAFPDFDCTILGMGNDGHTASIFPDSMDDALLSHEAAYAVSEHPKTKQKRITMTGRAILNSHEIFLPVLGEDKADILNKAISEAKSDKITLPASYMMRNSENLTLFTDSLKMQISG